MPFRLAGGSSRPERASAACAAGTDGVQVRSLFAWRRDSNPAEPRRSQLLATLGAERPGAPRAATSPTGFPCKVAQLAGTLSDEDVCSRRARICDLSHWHVPDLEPGGAICYRSSAETVDAHLRQGSER
ncbi:MAG TPA: hypothetical protein VED84_03875 [Acidimicrobiales bacterium]|nr:hypothetical protein [Acidimicrobiales bacterium]